MDVVLLIYILADIILHTYRPKPARSRRIPTYSLTHLACVVTVNERGIASKDPTKLGLRVRLGQSKGQRYLSGQTIWAGSDDTR